MGLFAREVIDEIERDLAKNSRRAGAAWVRNVQRHPAVPVDTGALRRGIRLVSATTRAPVQIRIASTTTNAGFDYPSHLDAGGAGGRHTGWWDAATSDDTLQDVMDELTAGV